MPTFTKVNPDDVAVGRGRAGAERRKPYIEALNAGDAGSVELERGEKPATVKAAAPGSGTPVERPHPLLVDGQPAAHAGVEEGRHALARASRVGRASWNRASDMWLVAVNLPSAVSGLGDRRAPEPTDGGVPGAAPKSTLPLIPGASSASPEQASGARSISCTVGAIAFDPCAGRLDAGGILRRQRSAPGRVRLEP